MDPYHTHVSIGIAYDDYTFAIVQNFEDNLIVSESLKPVMSINKYYSLTMQGRIDNGRINPAGELAPITIYYDELPTEKVYERYKDEMSYSLGEPVGCIIQAFNAEYCPSLFTLGSSWDYIDSPDYDTFTIRSNLEPLLDEPGVYTVVIWLEHEGGESSATSYSVWYDG
ncbi:hypothetical protein [Candidatus Nitrososphaera sp. FF02]|uniref:hypothetical protein n=1 Tax=Candidatus Nitrososphaera sp. FF02 TaxID=3398226 RepID=UPI0039E7B875